MFGGGTVFQLAPAGNGTWTETLLHDFGRAQDGIFPVGNLIFDSTGNLYGVNQFGGIISGSGGTVFELTASTGYGIEKILHNFNGQDAFIPEAGLVFDSSGKLYGTSVAGGIYFAGSLFRLTPSAGGGWTETIVHNFGASNDGQNPSCALVLDSSGHLYGTTAVGGQHGWGTVFEITP